MEKSRQKRQTPVNGMGEECLKLFKIKKMHDNAYVGLTKADILFKKYVFSGFRE